jgi:DNA (cytosine-5)-methyltransferase 1
MGKPRLLDLYCCAGGAGMGYARAGFRPYGVDKDPQPRYPFPFHQGDVLDVLTRLLAGEAIPFTHPDGQVEYLTLADFSGAHASPPCQFGTRMQPTQGRKAHLNFIPQTRALLEATALRWIIENVEGTEPWMPGAITLCGTMFGLGTQGHELRRHRLFIASFPISPPGPCQHSDRPVVGVYGGHARNRSAKHGGRGTRDTWEGGHRAAMSEAMGMTWATCAEMSEAIPPAFTEYLGAQLLSHIAAHHPREAA